ncbi:ph domain-containing protein [Stylonychia lemnae]|uniref:Ph domain-containing protein n=1 Tax=Stylonychia lemnae TaxID=5949 RepID=A0A078B3T1_STYLE|nr:ph domain-containing protein [Stylonychia lemnae]|eukprot:CDW89200.1 ph domain-containing protein [Stylonychia lemnae]
MLNTIKSKFSSVVNHNNVKIHPQPSAVAFDNEELKELTPIKEIAEKEDKKRKRLGSFNIQDVLINNSYSEEELNADLCGINIETDVFCQDQDNLSQKFKQLNGIKQRNPEILIQNDDQSDDESLSDRTVSLQKQRYQQLLDRSESKHTVISLFKKNYCPDSPSLNVRKRHQSESYYGQLNDSNSQSSCLKEKSLFYHRRMMESSLELKERGNSNLLNLKHLQRHSKTTEKYERDDEFLMDLVNNRSWINIEDQEQIIQQPAILDNLDIKIFKNLQLKQLSIERLKTKVIQRSPIHRRPRLKMKNKAKLQQQTQKISQTNLKDQRLDGENAMRQYRSISNYDPYQNRKDFDQKVQNLLKMRPILRDDDLQSDALPECQCNKEDLLAIQDCQIHSKIGEFDELKIPNQIVVEKDCDIIKQGWIKKKSTNFILGFQERFLVLYSNKKLVYYKQKHVLGESIFKHRVKEISYTSKQLNINFIRCGVFDLNVVVAEVQLVNACRFQLRFQGMNRVFTFSAQSDEECAEWKKVIDRAQYPDFDATEDNFSTYQKSQSGLQSMIRLDRKTQRKEGRFWKCSRMFESDLSRIADTGDILLFKNSEFSSSLQRMITKSNYNHVAVLIRCSEGQLKFIEATINLGVDVVDWDQFVVNRWYQNYDRVIYRRLRTERSQEQLIKLQNFLRAAIAKKYKVTASKLLRKKCVDDSDENIREDKTYFCSEIVASVYKNMGILPMEKSASQYMPGNFSMKKKIHLLKGAYLEEERLIDFEE